ncbi:methyltransferase type 12 [Fusarium albosuccineum]|uniref:Methyltransferase type 12 n=1 Tax=Fusarium albosuccineum TaxID=1237068 RepID=A0A8H4P6S6_9HYPO|nr:methyltransferase type 12 [Fusarium albosuccineum]
MAPSALTIIIGAGPTSGAGIARVLARQEDGNLAVALLARNPEKLNNLRNSIRKDTNGVVHSFPTDTQPDNLRQAFQDIANHPDFKSLKLKLAIYHVKHSSKKPFLEETAEAFNDSMQTYTTGAVVFAQEALKLIYAQNGGQTLLADTNGQKKGTIIFTGTRVPCVLTRASPPGTQSFVGPSPAALSPLLVLLFPALSVFPSITLPGLHLIAKMSEAPAAGTAIGEGELQPPKHWTEHPVPKDESESAADDAASSTASLSSSILEYRTINGRTYHSDRGSNQYWGPNDAQQNETLDIQHHVFTLAQNGRLHFAPLPPKIEKAVDIGTGTGLWAIDFGDQYPDTQVIGTDLSPIQPSWSPPNVQFQIDDFSQEWTFAEGSLDYVHTRWLIGCVTDWTALFKQAYKALKPGGWIESFEVNGFFESDDGTLKDKSALAQWGMIFREGAKKLGSTASFSVVRDGLQKKSLEEAGFVEIQEHPIKASHISFSLMRACNGPTDTRRYQLPTSGWPKDANQKKVGEFTKAAIENDAEGAVGFSASHLGWSQEEIGQYAAHLRRELRVGDQHAYYRANVAWAQKPGSS